MGQHKAIFIGRKSIDSGFFEYEKLSQRFNLILDIFSGIPNAEKFIHNYNFAFVSGYLTIIESLKNGVPVFAHYHNQLKFDYHSLSPYIKFVKLFHNYDDPSLTLDFDPKLIKAGQAWAKTQTWQKVADLYEELWSK